MTTCFDLIKLFPRGLLPMWRPFSVNLKTQYQGQDVSVMKGSKTKRINILTSSRHPVIVTSDISDSRHCRSGPCCRGCCWQCWWVELWSQVRRQESVPRSWSHSRWSPGSCTLLRLTCSTPSPALSSSMTVSRPADRTAPARASTSRLDSVFSSPPALMITRVSDHDNYMNHVLFNYCRPVDQVPVPSLHHLCSEKLSSISTNMRRGLELRESDGPCSWYWGGMNISTYMKQTIQWSSSDSQARTSGLETRVHGAVFKGGWFWVQVGDCLDHYGSLFFLEFLWSSRKMIWREMKNWKLWNLMQQALLCAPPYDQYP